MVMQLHQETETSNDPAASDGVARLSGISSATQARAHAQEVRLLRQRVAVLEQALDAAKAQAAGTTAMAGTEPIAQPTAGEFAGPVAPAVVAADTAPVTDLPPEDSNLDVVPDQGFVEAWTETEESSFEERIAQKAFFQVGSVDETSREWLLAN